MSFKTLENSLTSPSPKHFSVEITPGIERIVWSSAVGDTHKRFPSACNYCLCCILGITLIISLYSKTKTDRWEITKTSHNIPGMELYLFKASSKLFAGLLAKQPEFYQKKAEQLLG